jgi:hypothetical protein
VQGKRSASPGSWLQMLRALRYLRDRIEAKLLALAA